jgi:hypothetical protein
MEIFTSSVCTLYSQVNKLLLPSEIWGSHGGEDASTGLVTISNKLTDHTATNVVQYINFLLATAFSYLHSIIWMWWVLAQAPVVRVFMDSDGYS